MENRETACLCVCVRVCVSDRERGKMLIPGITSFTFDSSSVARCR